MTPRQTLTALIDGLISLVTPTDKITSTDHRAANAAMMDYVDTYANVWQKFTVTHTDLAAASGSSTFVFYMLPAACCVAELIVKSTIAFAGGSISGYVVDLGLAGDAGKYVSSYDVFANVSGTNFSRSDDAIQPINFAASTPIQIEASSVGANTNAATAGSIDIYLLISKLP